MQSSTGDAVLHQRPRIALADHLSDVAVFIEHLDLSATVTPPADAHRTEPPRARSAHSKPDSRRQPRELPIPLAVSSVDSAMAGPGLFAHSFEPHFHNHNRQRNRANGEGELLYKTKDVGPKGR